MHAVWPADHPCRLHEPIVVLLSGLPTGAAAASAALAQLTRGRSGGTLEVSPTRANHPSSDEGNLEDSRMAQALIGHLTSDPRHPARLAADNHRLRARIVELESLVLALKQENDALVRASAATLLEQPDDLEMQPV